MEGRYHGKDGFVLGMRSLDFFLEQWANQNHRGVCPLSFYLRRDQAFGTDSFSEGGYQDYKIVWDIK